MFYCIVFRFFTYKLFNYQQDAFIFSVLLSIYITLGLVFIPKFLYLYRVPESEDECLASNATAKLKLSKPEYKKYQYLYRENADLKRQIEQVCFMIH